VLLFSVSVTAIGGLFCGPALGFSAAHRTLTDSPRAGARTVAGQTSPKMRNALLTAQIALAVVLTIAAGLLVRTFQGLLHAERGFQIDHVLTFELSLPPAKYTDPDRMAELYSRALATLKTLPGVPAAGFVHAVPLGGAPDGTAIRAPGRTPKPNEQAYVNYMFPSPGYFATVRTPLLQGRDFDNSDTLNSPPVTVVNRAMAEALWPDQSAIGKQVGVSAIKYPVRTVIGIVANVKQTSLREEPTPEMYVPFTQNEIKAWPPMSAMQVALRTMGDPAADDGGDRQGAALSRCGLAARQSVDARHARAGVGEPAAIRMLLMIACGLLAMALLAGYLPARRAAQLDPATSLR
jgi:putative ABC transport system permease protein